MHKIASNSSSAALSALFLSAVTPGWVRIPVLLMGLMSWAWANGAVPVEESVEEPIAERASAGQTRPVVASANRPSSPSRRAPSLDIPPTIEPQSPTTNAAGPSGSGAAASGGLADMFYRMQLLEQEIQALRGQLEEQDYEIKRLKQDQARQYRDLDRRVAAMGNAPSNAVPGADSSEPTATPANGPVTTPVVATNERDAYRQAFEAMRGQQFDTSKIAFQKLIEDYPNGQYTPNAFYWLGEIFLVADQDTEQARQSFMQVVNLYPDHQKTPDALYKLGVVHGAMGENDTAKRFLDRVQSEYPDSSAASLARKYAAELP